MNLFSKPPSITTKIVICAGMGVLIPLIVLIVAPLKYSGAHLMVRLLLTATYLISTFVLVSSIFYRAASIVLRSRRASFWWFIAGAHILILFKAAPLIDDLSLSTFVRNVIALALAVSCFFSVGVALSTLVRQAAWMRVAARGIMAISLSWFLGSILCLYNWGGTREPSSLTLLTASLLGLFLWIPMFSFAWALVRNKRGGARNLGVPQDLGPR